MTAIIVKEIEFANRIEILKKDLHMSYYFTPERAFGTIDVNHKGVITMKILDDFLYKNSIFASEW